MGQGTYYKIDKHLPDDIHTRLCYLFTQAVSEGDWQPLLPYCAPTICIVNYEHHTYSGPADAVLGNFWLRNKDNRAFFPISGYWIHRCDFYAQTVVLVERPKTRYIIFRIRDDRITHIIFAPCTIADGVSTEYNPLEEQPYSTEYLDSVCGESIEPMANHLPCMTCGTLSETLSWRKITWHPKPDITLEGEVSVCPHCQRQAELHISKQIPPESESDDTDLPF